MQKSNPFSKKIPDAIMEELVVVLSTKTCLDFREIFDAVYAKLKEKNAISGGEEMVRLRIYEKLQYLVSRDMVKKEGKKYEPQPTLHKLSLSGNDSNE